MVYFASNATTPAMTAGGPQSYQNPYYKTQCGCGSSHGNGVNVLASGAREGFTAGAGPSQAPIAVPAPAVGVQAGAAPMCTLTATAPPAGCCHPAPLHCDCCDGSGYFKAATAYGS
jgi:hypothetical protein